MKKTLSCLITLLCVSHASAAEWDYPENAITITQSQEAKQYLLNTYPEHGDYRLRYTTTSTLGKHYNFDVWIEGQYKHQRSMVLSTNNDGRIVRIFKSLTDTVLNSGKPTTAAELEAPRSLKAVTPPSLPSGHLVNAELNVFDPDLRSMLRSPAPSSQMMDISEFSLTPQYVSKISEVLFSNGHYYLSNSRVRQVDALALVTPTSSHQAEKHTLKEKEDNNGMLPQEGVATFSSLDELNTTTINDANFPQIMAFSHLDLSVRYIESLGFNIFQKPIDFDARGLSANNSTYYYGAKAILLGIGGGSPDALDADVILHELGHGIHYHIIPDWAYGHTGAIGEGFGDYWAGSYSYRQQFRNANSSGQEFEIDTVFNWDGYFGNKRNTRSLWNQRARYFKRADYRAHESVAGELGDELWSTPLFQSLKNSVSLYGDSAFTEFDTIVLESMYGLGRGLKMHDLAESMVFVAKTLYPEKKYAQILTEKFKHHGLLLAPFKQEFASRYIGESQKIHSTLYPTERQASVSGEVTLNGKSKNVIDSDLFDKLDLNLDLPSSATCGDSFEVSTQLTYQYNPSLLLKDWKNKRSLIKGVPVFTTDFPAVNSHIPDATVDNSGRPIAGLKTVNFTVTDRDGIVDDSFGVYLNLNHNNLLDLTVTLISPRGTRVILLNHQDTNLTTINDYFTLKHDEILQTFKGEPSWGTWRLELADLNPNDSGKLIRWGVGAISSYQCDQTSPTTTNASSGGSLSFASLFLLILIWGGRRLSFK